MEHASALRQRLERATIRAVDLARTLPGRLAVAVRQARVALSVSAVRWIAVVFLILLVVIIANGLLALRALSALADREQLVSHTHLIEVQLSQIDATITRAETGERGYIITGNETYLASYTSVQSTLDGEVAKLQALTTDNSAQQRRIPELKHLLAAKLDEMRQTIELRKQGRTQQAIDVVLSNSGQQHMDAIRNLLSQMQQTEEDLLIQRTHAAQTTLTAASVTVILATLINLLLLLLAYSLTQRAFMRREQAARERERHLEDERRARAEAENAVRLRDQFLSIASHELKTPLTAMRMHIELLERRLTCEGGLGERHTRGFSAVVRQLTRMQALIGAMLDVSRIERGQLDLDLAPTDIAALARTIAEEVQPTTDAHTIAISAPEAPLYINGDAMRLEQVLQNLVHNAIKYSPNGGAIHVEVTRDGAMARIRVRDEGMGIAPEALPRLFERFYRAPNATSEHISGMGIGLHLVREIVRLHGGEIAVSSVEGAGSTFTIRLPLLPAGEPSAARLAPSRAAAGQSPTAAQSPTPEAIVPMPMDARPAQPTDERRAPR